MNLECPSCHKHRFKPRQFMMARMSPNDYSVECPHCGASLFLDVKAGNIINLMTFFSFFVFMGILVAFDSWVPKEQGPMVFVPIGMVLMVGSRWVGVLWFGKIVPAGRQGESAPSLPHIRLTDVATELAQLKENGEFIVLYSPDQEYYLSFIREKGAFIADLAFAIGKFKDMEPKFREGVARAGATAHPYKKRGMSGVEAKLGTDPQAVALKVQTIMQETFGLKSDAEVPIQRN